jgi:hypothetical protein
MLDLSAVFSEEGSPRLLQPPTFFARLFWVVVWGSWACGGGVQVVGLGALLSRSYKRASGTGSRLS